MDASQPAPQTDHDLINLNTATETELRRLPGVGPVRAACLIRARPIRSWRDLRRVEGIGWQTAHQIERLATLGDAETPASQLLRRAMREIDGPRPGLRPSPSHGLARTTQGHGVIDAAHRFPGDRDIRHPPGLEWTTDQLAAIRAIRHHLRTRLGEPFVLAGYAGTGKTTLLVEALRPFPAPLLIAPTHKAAAVLAPKAQALGGESGTVHRWLGYRRMLDRNTGEEVFRIHRPERWRGPQPGQPVVVDEVSMLGEELWTEVCVLARQYRVPIVAMGDPLQLPPVGEGDLSPAFREPAGVELREVVRSAGLLTQKVLSVRERIEDETPPRILASERDDHGQVEVMRSSRAFVDDLIGAFSEGRDAIALAYRNASVQWINDAVRRAIVGDDPRPFAPGEVLVVTKPYTIEPEVRDWTCPWDDGDDPLGVRFQTETRLVIRDVEPARRLDFACWRIGVDVLGFHADPLPRDPGEVARPAYYRDVYILDRDQAKPYKRQMADIRRALAAATPFSTARGLAASKLDAYRGAFLDARPGYATTVHKSQGSTWAEVYVAQGDICIQSDPFERNRLLYVAFSRASKRLVVCG